ncbi:suppressor of fused domain protein [Brachybacterium sp. DNPG3]
MGILDIFRRRSAPAASSSPSAVSVSSDPTSADDAATSAASAPGAAAPTGDDAPGWEAITAAAEAVHPGQTSPPHAAATLPMALGGPDALYGVSFYRQAESAPHWHLVSYGLSDLFSGEVVEDPEQESGWGLELTIRVADPAALEADAEPPIWAASLLQNLARYVITSRRIVAPGDQFDVRGPIRVDDPTALSALLFVEDPQLGTLRAPAGSVRFVQVVGATAEDLEDAQRWSTPGVLGLLADRDPMLVTDLSRRSVRDLPGMAERIAEGIRTEGSSTLVAAVQMVEIGEVGEFGQGGPGPRVRITLGATAVEPLHRLLSGRIAHGRPGLLSGPEQSLMLLPVTPGADGPDAGADGPDAAADGLDAAADGRGAGVRITEHGADLRVTPELAAELAAVVRPVAGEYPLSAVDAVVVVVPSPIRDEAGNVVRTVG